MKYFATICTVVLLGLTVPFSHSSAQTYTVGDTVCFTVAAVDMNGDTLRDWDQTGVFCNLTLNNSTANVDTSSTSWNANPDAYSWALVLHNGTPLPFVPPSTWTLPNTIFTDGKTEICVVHTKADTGVQLSLCPGMVSVKTNAGPFHFEPDTVDNFLVEVTSSTGLPDQVYRMRRYELLVSPRDKYLNVTNQQVETYFHARYDNEFVIGQGANIFAGAIFITGPTNYFLTSAIAHGKADGQWIAVQTHTNGSKGFSNNYEILDHAPIPFELEYPADGQYLKIVGPQVPEEFTWEKSTDPYTNVQLSRFSGTLANDVVQYTVHFVDSATLTKRYSVGSDGAGVENKYSLIHSELEAIAKQLLGDVNVFPLMWYVEATDGLYITQNIPADTSRALPGRYLILDYPTGPLEVSALPATPSGITLHQNYPNPVTAGSTTNIRFETTAYGPVSLKVYDMLGSEVATVTNNILAPGVYNADFTATGLPPGVYHYTLSTETTTVTKSMVIVKE